MIAVMREFCFADAATRLYRNALYHKYGIAAQGVWAQSLKSKLHGVQDNLGHFSDG